MNKIYLEIAYKEALKAFKKGEVPVGAVIVKNNKVLCKSHNSRQKYNNLLGHAEINCILKAEKKIKDWRLDDCELYATLEPCELCQIFIKESRIKDVHFILKRKNSKNGKKSKLQTNVCSEINDDYINLLNTFFKNLRN